jgi:hypothetical protein
MASTKICVEGARRSANKPLLQRGTNRYTFCIARGAVGMYAVWQLLSEYSFVAAWLLSLLLFVVELWLHSRLRKAAFAQKLFDSIQFRMQIKGFDHPTIWRSVYCAFFLNIRWFIFGVLGVSAILTFFSLAVLALGFCTYARLKVTGTAATRPILQFVVIFFIPSLIILFGFGPEILAWRGVKQVIQSAPETLELGKRAVMRVTGTGLESLKQGAR